MTGIREYLKNKICNIISSWNEEDIYAISFFLFTNEVNEYRGYSNITEFSVSYNTERDCNFAEELSEERWNYAYWRQNETPILVANDNDEGMKVLFNWYKENGIENIGYEDYGTCYDREMRFIGKGPIGLHELISELTTVARDIQESGFTERKFGKRIPIIIHDLEYPWYIIEACKKANPNGEADMFLKAMKMFGTGE
ncbi:MAG: hypothetical protein J6Q85_00250 [Clostridia bacterium]|nr:hypothetical protein [Clostridia bacterium]